MQIWQINSLFLKLEVSIYRKTTLIFASKVIGKICMHQYWIF